MSDARNQAIAQVESIVDLIRAYNVDFDRLEELRDDQECGLTEDEAESLIELGKSCNSHPRPEE